MVEPEDELEDEPEEPEEAELDGGDAGDDVDVPDVEPDSLLAGVFSGSPLGLSLASLAGLSGCFAWLGSFSLFE